VLKNLKIKVKVKAKVQVKKVRFGPALTSTSACLLVPLRGGKGVPYDGPN